jgi:hypothetical protein
MLQQMLQAGISYSRLYNKIRQAQAAEAAYFSAISSRARVLQEQFC